MEGKSQFWVGLSIIWISHLFMDFMIGVWPVYKTIIELDLVIAGMIASLSMFIGEGLQLYFGFLSDKGNHRKLLALGIGLTATIPFLSYVENEWLLFLMVLCAFIGSGAFHPSGSGLVLGGNSKSKGVLISFFLSGGMVGAALSQTGYSFLYYTFEGHIAFLALPIIVCALCCTLFPFPKVENQVKKLPFTQVLQALKPFRYQLGLLYVIHVFLQIVVLSLAFLLPDILTLKGYETWFCLGGGYFCFIIGSVLTSMPIGFCIDKLGYRFVLTGIVIASASFLYLFLAVETLSLLVPMTLLLLLGGTMGVIIPVVVAGGIQNVPSHTQAFVSSLYMGGTICLAGFGPLLASYLSSFFDEQGAVVALQGLSSLLIVSLLLIYYLPDIALISEEPQLAEVPSTSEGDIL